MAIEENKYVEDIKKLEEKIANREAMIVARGEQMPLFKYEELKEWKNQLKDLRARKILEEEFPNREEPPETQNPEEPPKTQKSEELTEDNNKDLPRLDLLLNIKTGECILVDLSNEEKYEMKIRSKYYTKQSLNQQTEYIIDEFEIPEEDKKYLKNVDPTILRAYMNYDNENSGKYNQSAAKMYVDAVIDSSKKLENGKKIEAEEVKMPGKVKIDLRTNLKLKDTRSKKDKFRGLSGIINLHRAKKILTYHSKNKMNLAEVLENKILNRLRNIIGFSALATALIGVGVKVYNKSLQKESTDENIENTKEDNGINKSNKEDEEIVVTDDGAIVKNKDIMEESKQDINETATTEQNDTEIYNDFLNDEIELGSIVLPERYSAIYESSDAIEPNGALGNVNKAFGVNKIACVIDGKVYSTKNYSTDEIYQMAKDFGVEVRYHIDEACIIDGKTCVQIKEQGNPISSYVYYENGIFKYLNGREFTGDVESGIGWIDSKNCEKSELKLENQLSQNTGNITQEEQER